MFNIGDQVVYPMHGAGTIEKIETKQILGEVRDYYVLRISYGDLKVMIPVDNSQRIGVRSIVDHETLQKAMALLGAETTAMSDNWNRRNRDNMEKLKSGDLANVVEVIRTLMRADRVKKLSTGEKKMLSNARQILISEIVLVEGISQEEAEKRIAEAV